MITQDRLKNSLCYNSNTGEFTWKISKRANSVEDGAVAGCSHNGYTRIQLDGKGYLAHRLAWLYVHGHFPSDYIDHINHNKKDNRIKNLRVVTHQQNHMNEPIQANNTSGTTGVYLDSETGKWRANIRANGKCIHLGRFADKSEAVNARIAANTKYGFHNNHGLAI